MSKLTSLIQSRFQTVAHGSKEKQKGASALEYLVLAAVIIVGIAIVGALFFSGTGDGTIGGAFTKIGEKLETEVSGGTP